MKTAKILSLLNRLLAMEYRSLAMYLTDATPWTHHGDEVATEALQDIVSDQRTLVSRIAERIQVLGGQVEPSQYPIGFTDTHFLSLDFLLKELVYHQRQTLSAIEQLVAQLAGDRGALELAQEALGTERAHLESLDCLVRQPT